MLTPGTMTDYDAILIAGPTASGKSSFAVELAKICNGIVVNADSMQVYSDLRILSARPMPDDEHSIPHWLYGHVDGSINYSVGHYAEDAAKALEEARNLGVKPIFVGGTGLYFKALIEGLSDIPAVPDEVRDEIRSWAQNLDTPLMHEELLRRDPEAAKRLKPNDRLRVMRALEVHAATGQSILSFQDARIPGPLAEKATMRIFLAPDRETVRSRIDSRFLDMMTQGALDEVGVLAKRNLDPMLPVMRAHGVPGLLAYLRGGIGLDEAIAKGQGDTRRYAKRQFTWARHQMTGWTWLDPDDAEAMEAVFRS